MTNHTDLIAALEAATVEEAPGLLAEAFEFFHGENPLSSTYSSKYITKLFSDKLTHGAPDYISPAMMLVPEHFSLTLSQNVHHKYWHITLQTLNWENEPMSAFPLDGRTYNVPGCAIAAATLKAIMEGEG